MIVVWLFIYKNYNEDFILVQNFDSNQGPLFLEFNSKIKFGDQLI